MGTWVLSDHDSSAAPQTVQIASPVCGTKNFSSVRLYSAPQLHCTIVAIPGICASDRRFSSPKLAHIQTDRTSRTAAKPASTTRVMASARCFRSSRWTKVSPSRVIRVILVVGRLLRSSPGNGHRQGRSPCLKGAMCGHQTIQNEHRFGLINLVWLALSDTHLFPYSVNT